MVETNDQTANFRNLVLDIFGDTHNLRNLHFQYRTWPRRFEWDSSAHFLEIPTFSAPLLTEAFWVQQVILERVIGMNQLRTQGGKFKFTPSQPEQVFTIPRLDLLQLVDVELSFWTEPPDPDINVTALDDPQKHTRKQDLDDLHIYFDGKDITNSVKTELIRVLNADNRNNLSAYKSAMQRYLDMTQKIGIFADHMVDVQVRQENKLIGKSWNDHFPRIGNAGEGEIGCLHPMNFLFREIPIEAISLRQALYPSVDIRVPVFANVSDPRLVISHGPSRLFVTPWQPSANVYCGGLTFLVSTVYHDAWEDQMAIAMNDLRSQLNSVQTSVANLTSSLNDIYTRLGAFDTTTKKIESSIKELAGLLGQTIN